MKKIIANIESSSIFSVKCSTAFRHIMKKIMPSSRFSLKSSDAFPLDQSFPIDRPNYFFNNDSLIKMEVIDKLALRESAIPKDSTAVFVGPGAILEHLSFFGDKGPRRIRLVDNSPGQLQWIKFYIESFQKVASISFSKKKAEASIYMDFFSQLYELGNSYQYTEDDILENFNCHEVAFLLQLITPNDNEVSLEDFGLHLFVFMKELKAHRAAMGNRYVFYSEATRLSAADCLRRSEVGIDQIDLFQSKQLEEFSRSYKNISYLYMSNVAEWYRPDENSGYTWEEINDGGISKQDEYVKAFKQMMSCCFDDCVTDKTIVSHSRSFGNINAIKVLLLSDWNAFIAESTRDWSVFRN
jgi:hypothetical protein